MFARTSFLAMSCALFLDTVVFGAGATVEEALELVPVQADVDLDKPAADKIAQCKLDSFPGSRWLGSLQREWSAAATISGHE